MKILLTATAMVITLASASADAWWNNNQQDWNNNWNNNGYYDGRYNNTYDGTGDTAGDGSLGFNADFRFKMKMRNRGDGRMDAYNYGDWGNGGNNYYNNGYYNNSGQYYGNGQRPYYAPNYAPGYAAPQYANPGK